MPPPLSKRLGLQRLSELSGEQRRKLWAWIRQNDQPMAAAMEQQKTLLEMCRAELDPSTTVVLPIDYVRRALQGADSE